MKRVFWTLVSALLLVAAAAVPASASNGPISYKWLDCPAGTVTGQIDSGGMIGTSMVVQGEIRPCRQPANTEVYGLAVYLSDGTARGKATALSGWEHLYPDFEGQIGGMTGAQAICLIVGPIARLDCRAVTVTVVNGNSILSLGDRISVDSPIVSISAYVSLDSGAVGAGPQCPTCWP